MNEEVNYIKSEIVKNMIQYTRVKELGIFIDGNGFRNIFGYNDRDLYADGFLIEAKTRARELLFCYVSVEDYEVDE